MRLIDLSRDDDPAALAEVAAPALDPALVEAVAGICEQVRTRGDAALVELTRRFDGVDIGGRIRVTEEQMQAAADRVPAHLVAVLQRLADRLRIFHEAQAGRDWDEKLEGVAFGERHRPLASVGCYAPGGRARYPSTVVMTAVPAAVAGVTRVVLASPPTTDGDIAPELLVAARAAGVTDVVRVGGAQAIAALAFGTESVPAAVKVVGPGNAWVTAAKRHVLGTVGIDSLAGPSDATVVSDGSVDVALVAAELVAQAEHDPDARAFLVATDRAHVTAVLAEADRHLSATPRAGIARQALAHSAVILCRDLQASAAVVDRLAPEHLYLAVTDPEAYLEGVSAYGAAFLGPLTSVVFGDYGGTSNHTLPTMGTARFSSGLRTTDFQTSAVHVRFTADAVRRLAPDVEALATSEGLPAHAAAARLRREMVESGAAG